jgi:hypothetical protein
VFVQVSDLDRFSRANRRQPPVALLTWLGRGENPKSIRGGDAGGLVGGVVVFI